MFEVARIIISHKIRDYKPNVDILIENSRVIIKTVSNGHEIGRAHV